METFRGSSRFPYADSDNAVNNVRGESRSMSGMTVDSVGPVGNDIMRLLNELLKTSSQFSRELEDVKSQMTRQQSEIRETLNTILTKNNLLLSKYTSPPSASATEGSCATQGSSNSKQPVKAVKFAPRETMVMPTTIIDGKTYKVKGDVMAVTESPTGHAVPDGMEAVEENVTGQAVDHFYLITQNRSPDLLFMNGYSNHCLLYTSLI